MPDSADRGTARALAGRDVGGPGHRMLMPGLLAQPVIQFAISRRQVTITDCNKQSMIS